MTIQKSYVAQTDLHKGVSLVPFAENCWWFERLCLNFSCQLFVLHGRFGIASKWLCGKL